MVAIETCPRLAVNAAIFLACFALPVASRLWRSLKWGEKAAVTIDPDNPHPDFLRDCFALVARSLDERPRRLRLEIDVRNKDGLGVKFDLERDGRYAFSVDGRRTCHADFRRRWIADHPVPLTMCGGRFRRGRVRLFVEPVDGNRFRVMSSLHMPVPSALAVACALLAAAGFACGLPEFVSASFGIVAGFIVLRIIESIQKCSGIG